MRVVFAGTPVFAATALEALLAAGHEILLVLSQPDRPSGRGMKVTPSAVSAVAAAHGIATHKPESLRPPEAHAPIRACAPDVLVVAAYGLILPQAVLDIPLQGALNIHASLLPRWRGAAPVQRALLAGDTETGVGIMKMEAGLDTGPVLLEKRIPVGERDTAATLTDRLARLGAEAIVEALANLKDLVPRPQQGEPTYAAKIGKAEGRLDWRLPAEELDRRIRAFNPFPGAETVLGGETLKIWEARPAGGSGSPGTVLAGPAGVLRIACGAGALDVLAVQRPGGRRLRAADFLRGIDLPAGSPVGAQECGNF